MVAHFSLSPTALVITFDEIEEADRDTLAVTLQRYAQEGMLLFIPFTAPEQQIIAPQSDQPYAAFRERVFDDLSDIVDSDNENLTYRETIAGVAFERARVIRQTSCPGLYADLTLQVEPIEGAGEVNMGWHVGSETIPAEFAAAVFDGIQEAAFAGGPHGLPLVNLHVLVIDGSHHPVDSSARAFRMAAAKALKGAIAKAGTRLIQPRMRLNLQVTDGDYDSVFRQILRGHADAIDVVMRGDTATITDTLGQLSTTIDLFDHLPQTLAFLEYVTVTA